MLSKRCLGLICGAFLFAAAHANAQGIFRGQPVIGAGPGQVSSAIGPNGTYYALVPGNGSTMETPVTELVAIGPPSAPAQLWSVPSISGQVSAVLPGANTVFVVQTVTSGTGRSTTTTTSVLLYSAASGATTGLTNVTPSGTIDDIEVRTIGSMDYLYVYTTSTSTSTNNGTTTVTTTRTLTVYSQTGAVVGKPMTL